MEPRRLTSDFLAQAAQLFSVYPHKTAQQKNQRLERDRLNAFYFKNLTKAVEQNTPHWLVSDASGAPLALAGLATDAWHSQIYGLAMGKLQPWLNTINPAAGDPLLQAALAEARARQLQHLSVRLDANDFPNLQLFERHGFYTVDVSLKLSVALPLAPSTLATLQPPPSTTTANLQISLANETDHAWIRDLGSTTHGGTHFLNDPHLAPEATQRLFSAWLDKCLNGLAYRVYTLKHSGTGEGLGFVTYLRAGTFAQAVGRTPLILDFVLISPALRGGGIGPWFIAQTLARESAIEAANEASNFDYCELRTSAHNLAAVMNYEKLGFRCCAADMVLHHLLA